MAQLQNVNTTDVLDAIRLGCRTMQSVFNADDNDIPFFRSRLYPEAYLAFSANVTESHVPGRHLNALLSAEDAAGIDIDEEAVRKHANAAFFSFGGPLPFPLNRKEITAPLSVWEIHNLREGAHALYALVRFLNCERAMELAVRMIDVVFEYWTPAGRWDCDRIQRETGLEVSSYPFITGEGRAIGPLVKLFRATGHAPALDLATAMAEKALDEFFLADGRYDAEAHNGHTHSTTCVMSSLAQLAELTSDGRMMERVRQFYDKGLWGIRDGLGWVIENAFAPDHLANHGESNNTGDIVETALILGRWGYAEYLADAEAIVRGHLLPSQLRDNSFIEDPPNPDGEDGKRNVADRHLGAFGFPAPYGHRAVGAEMISFNMDIVGGAVGSLCDVWRDAIVRDEAGHRVNLLFDRESDAIDVNSPYTHEKLRVTVKEAAPLWVRIPAWVDRDGLTVTGSERWRFAGDFLFVPRPTVGGPINIAFDLPERRITLHHRTREIRVRLRGDEVTAMDNYGADLTYFPQF